MNITAAKDAYAVLDEPTTLTIERRLPGPPERIWAYLTESDLRRQWLAAGEMDLKVGAPFELVWRNDDLTEPPGNRPSDFNDEHRMQTRITALDAPNKLAFAWGDSGEVTFELRNDGNDVILTVTHRRLPERSTRLLIAAGWHAHLDVLVARATSTEAEPFWDHWSRLKKEYDERLPA